MVRGCRDVLLSRKEIELWENNVLTNEKKR